MKQMVNTGLDLWVADGFKAISGKRIALLCNHAAVDSNFQHLADLINAKCPAKIVRILAPEHGFRGALQDMDGVSNAVDPKTGIEVVSLYGATKDSLAPKAEHLAGIDCVVCDLPDIGSRYYTFAQTIGLLLQAAAPLKLPVYLLDRPNPIDGRTIEGAPLLKPFRSFCGYAPVPNRHGLTMGELCLMMNRGFGSGQEQIPQIGADLKVIQASGWDRGKYFDETSLPWVFPSPNMPTLETAVVYPGTCLLEATNLSEGRGTTRPFELIGAPFIESDRWIEAAADTGLPLEGAVLRPVNFIPKFQKWSGQSCSGVQIHVTDRAKFKPFRWALALIAAAKKLYPGSFAWRGEMYEFEEKIPAIDLLYGSARFREIVENDQSLAVLEAELSATEERFSNERQAVLLY